MSGGAAPAAQPVLETARLRLRPFVAADAPAVRALAGDRAIADTTLTVPHPYPEGAAEAWIATHAPGWAAGTMVVYAVTDAADGTLLGAVGLHVVREHAHAELGYWVGVPHWGRGVATEAARALVDLGFRTLGLHRIHARHLTRNPASGRVMQKLGMRLEGVHREALRKWGAFEDVALYAVLDREWDAEFLRRPSPGFPATAPRRGPSTPPSRRGTPGPDTAGSDAAGLMLRD